MALSKLTGSSSKYEPLPRFHHNSSRVGSKVVVQGGLTKDFSEKSRRHLSSVVEIFDPYSESWEQRPVTGDAPSPATFLAASASLHDDLFSFGGTDDWHFFNTLRRLDPEKLCWSPQNADGAPMPKYGCGMIAFGSGLGVFGGFGVPRGLTEPRSFIQYTGDTDGRGWTNEFHIYNLSEGNLLFPLHVHITVSNSGRLCFLKKVGKAPVVCVCVIVAPPIYFGAWMTAC